MNLTPALVDRLRQAIDRQRLVDTAVQLIAVPSRTGEAGPAADCLAAMLEREGYAVERPTGGYPEAPAVVARYSSGRPGRTLQFNGHLDTVHLPFVPPRVENGSITGSGASDMKSGIAAAVEAMRALRATEALPGGGILLTAHDLHESPWGDGRQLNRMIEEGLTGDAVLLPEYLCDRLPVIGRGGLIWRATIRRPGKPVHEVFRPSEPSVIGAGAEVVSQIQRLNERLQAKTDPLAGSESAFIGQVHSGEIFNQYPQECFVEGTRRWLPGTQRADVEQELQSLLQTTAQQTGTAIEPTLTLMRDSFLLDRDNPFVSAFQNAHQTAAGRTLPIGAKPFADDGNSFWSLAKIPAITHGPEAGGAHTLNEWVSIDSLERQALVYALTAVAFCPEA